MNRGCLMLFGLLISSMSFSQQSNHDLADEKKHKAVQMMDNGSIDESIELLEEAKKLDPESYVYDYEIGFAYSLKKEYSKAIETFKQVIKYKDANDQCYQMLGNLYDNKGDYKKAIKTYDKGLKLFPNSGRLFLEKGTAYAFQKKYNEAIKYYENGIKVDPIFPSNYYRAASLFFNSEDEVWAMIYGEIFINLESNSRRTQEISKLLFDTYRSQIKFISDTSLSVSFCKNSVITLTDEDLKNPGQIKLPFGSAVYEPTLLLSIDDEKKIDLNSLNRIRQNFLDTYYKKSFNTSYPNVLFERQKSIKDSGNFEAYNFWLLSSGDPDAFNLWKDNNEEKWNKFVLWFNDNGFQLDSEHQFLRGQY